MWRRPVFNLANLLTLSRFAAGPVVAVILLRMGSPCGPPPDPAPASPIPSAGALPPPLSFWAFLLLGLALLTDLLDGWVARRLKAVTDFGKIMDPVADSTFCMVVLVALSASPRFRDHFPVWIPLVVLYREVGIQVLRRYGALNGQVLAARWSGKIKMFSQSVALLGFLALLAWSDLQRQIAESASGPGLAEGTLGRVAHWTGAFVAFVNVASLAEYLRDVPALVHDWRPGGQRP